MLSVFRLIPRRGTYTRAHDTFTRFVQSISSRVQQRDRAFEINDDY